MSLTTEKTEVGHASLLSRLGSPDPLLRRAAQNEANRLPSSELLDLVRSVILRADCMAGSLLPLPVYLTLMLIPVAFILLLLSMTNGWQGWMMDSLLGAGLVAGVTTGFWFQKRTKTKIACLHEWLSQVEDISVVTAALPPLTLPNQTAGSMQAHYLVLKRLLPRLQKEDYATWSVEERRQLREILRWPLANVEVTLATVQALGVLDSFASRTWLQQTANMKVGSSILNAPVETSHLSLKDLQRIKEAAQGALPSEMLLRASSVPDHLAQGELLRPVEATDCQTPPEQLLRPG